MTKKKLTWIFLLIGVVLLGTGLSLKLVFQKFPSLIVSTTSTLSQNNNLTLTNMNKKILMVIAFQDFRDEEYFVPKEILEKNGFTVETVSSKVGLAIGVEGGAIEVSKTAKEIETKNYDGVIFVGGPGMTEELDNLDFQKLARDFNQENKLVSAICIAPALLAKAKLLENKRATVWSSPLDKSAIKILRENGSIYADQPVVVDGKIITANGPEAAKDFGEAIVKFFESR
ncbi:MAG TPA: DJ-1/PfpI family protein [Candidatus Paceibacterota bacterium]|nr:DJ-1/PfpI family protein [Candidatus Paceibacterota bacterium]